MFEIYDGIINGLASAVNAVAPYLVAASYTFSMVGTLFAVAVMAATIGVLVIMRFAPENGKLADAADRLIVRSVSGELRESYGRFRSIPK